MLPSLRSVVVVIAGLGLAGGLLLVGCERAPAPVADEAGATRPTQAVTLPAQRLRDNDLGGYVRVAVPPELIPPLQQAWKNGLSRWPLSELPLDGKLPSLLAALAADGSEQRYQAVFEQQFAGAQRELKSAAATLTLFGVQYLQTEGDFSDSQRAHYTQLIKALGAWAGQAPLADPARADAAIARLTAAARATGLASEADFTAAGMSASLRRLEPFLAAFKATLADYGLDLDRSLDGLRAGLISRDGDHARVRLRYRLGEARIDTVVEVERRDGRWYRSDTLREIEKILQHAEEQARAREDMVRVPEEAATQAPTAAAMP